MLDVHGDMGLSGNIYRYNPNNPLQSYIEVGLWTRQTVPQYTVNTSTGIGTTIDVGVVLFNDPLTPYVSINTVANTTYGLTIGGTVKFEGIRR